MSNRIWIWIAFSIFVLAMLALDLGVFHRKAHEVKIKEALVWSAVWIALALFFNLGIHFWRGEVAALEFLTGYLLEKSLSVDNVFVFLLIFSYFRVPHFASIRFCSGEFSAHSSCVLFLSPLGSR